MDVNVSEQAKELAKSSAGQATTMEDLKDVVRTRMKSALKKMLGAARSQSARRDEAQVDRGRSRPVGARRACDRGGTFEPQLFPKHQRRLSGIDETILALYDKGMMTRDIQ